MKITKQVPDEVVFEIVLSPRDQTKLGIEWDNLCEAVSYQNGGAVDRWVADRSPMIDVLVRRLRGLS